jgi:hypothetical protein
MVGGAEINAGTSFRFWSGPVFVSALGNNSVEVLSIFGGIVEDSITKIPNPQGIAFSPEAHKLFVASANGKFYVYDADALNLITTLDFEGGEENLRYDAATKRVYVGCGDDRGVHLLVQKQARPGVNPYFETVFGGPQLWSACLVSRRAVLRPFVSNSCECTADSY